MSIIIFSNQEYSWKNMTLWDFLQEGNYPSKWEDFFSHVQEMLHTISNGIHTESPGCTIYPPLNRVFRVFSMPLEHIRVVILGQDPYHNGNAVGLCFSVPKGKAINPSLINIYTELELEGYTPTRDGDLTPWVKQGCFMLNTALTVQKGAANSHTAVWYDFSEKVIQYIVKNSKDIAWLLMGSSALEFREFIIGNGHKIFCTSHPSPLGAFRGFRDIPAFTGSGIFRKINNFLGKKSIKW